jgi:hypothetical protein
MQMDAGFKKEQIGTLFCLVGALEGGLGGWVVSQGCPPQRVTRVTRVTRMAYSPSLWLMANHPKKYTCLPKEFNIPS